MKFLLYILVGSILAVSCDTKNTSSKSESDSKKIVSQYFEHFNKHEWEKLAGLYSDSADFKDPSFGNGIVKQTHQQIIEKYKQLNGFLPDINTRIVNQYETANNVIVEFISSGSSPGGMKFELPICTIFTIDNGKITKDHTYYNNGAPSSSK